MLSKEPRILLIEPDEAIRTETCDFLTGKNFEVICSLEPDTVLFDEALKTVTDTVNNWQAILKTSSIKVSSVGKLSLNEEKQVVFEPNITVNYLTESFGLASFESSAIARFKEEVKPLIPVIETTSEEKKKVIPLFVKYAATAAILVGVAYTGWNGIQNQSENESLATQQQAEAKQIQSATFVIDNPLPTINLNVVKETPKPYHVIAGAFQMPENAEKKVQQLKRKGYNAKIIGVNKWGLTQVTYNSYSDRNTATNSLYKIQKTVSKDAWLLIEK